jgi:hypothetical protein
MGHWTDEEVSILKSKYPDHTEDELEELLDRSGEAIRRKAQRVGVPKIDNYIRVKSIINSDWIDLEQIDSNFGHFISGFTAGEGSFVRTEVNRRDRDRYRFQIAMAECDEDILYEIQEVLKCGNIHHYDARSENEQPTVALNVNQFGDLYKKVIPFFEEYRLQNTHKRKQFNEWKSAIEEQIHTERFK